MMGRCDERLWWNILFWKCGNVWSWFCVVLCDRGIVWWYWYGIVWYCNMWYCVSVELMRFDSIWEETCSRQRHWHRQGRGNEDEDEDMRITMPMMMMTITKILAMRMKIPVIDYSVHRDSYRVLCQHLSMITDQVLFFSSFQFSFLFLFCSFDFLSSTFPWSQIKYFSFFFYFLLLSSTLYFQFLKQHLSMIADQVLFFFLQFSFLFFLSTFDFLSSTFPGSHIKYFSFFLLSTFDFSSSTFPWSQIKYFSFLPFNFISFFFFLFLIS